MFTKIENQLFKYKNALQVTYTMSDAEYQSTSEQPENEYEEDAVVAPAPVKGRKPKAAEPVKMPVKLAKKAIAAAAEVLGSEEEDTPKPKGRGRAEKAVNEADPAKPVKRGVSEETLRYKKALKELEKTGLVIFEELTPRALHVKLNTLMIKWILAEIAHLKTVELNGENDPANPYPSNEWATSDTKVAGKDVVTKKAPKARIRPGVLEIDDPVEVSVESEEEVVVSSDKKIKNIVTGNINCKNYLAFIMIRFIHELNYAKTADDVETAADFKKFVFEQINDKIKSQLSRVIICTVDRLRSAVKGAPAFEFSDISKIFSNSIFAEYEKPKTPRRPGIARHAAEYLLQYYQLIAKFLAAEIWVKHRSINGVTIEQAMRCMNIGNDTQGRGFEMKANVLRDMHTFDQHISPPGPAVPRKPRVKKTEA